VDTAVQLANQTEDPQQELSQCQEPQPAKFTMLKNTVTYLSPYHQA